MKPHIALDIVSYLMYAISNSSTDIKPLKQSLMWDEHLKALNCLRLKSYLLKSYQKEGWIEE